MFNKLVVKVFSFALIAIVVSIGVALTYGLVQERKERSSQSIGQIQQRWGGEQNVTGLYLRIPYSYNVSRTENGKDVISRYTSDIVLMPIEQKINIDAPVHSRHLGIYACQVYTATINSTSTFNYPDLKALGIDSSSVDWKHAILECSVSENRGLGSNVKVDFNGMPYELSLTGHKSITGDASLGCTVELPAYMHGDVALGTGTLSSSLRGSRWISFIPLGKTTWGSITSPWPSPKSIGKNMPEDGAPTHKTDLHWNISKFGRRFSQQYTADREAYTSTNENDYYKAYRSWQPDESSIPSSAVGVAFISVVDVYDNLSRSIKYVYFIVLLTFSIFFCIDVMRKLTIHSMQYLFVCLAVVVFYVLLLGLSEFIPFITAYVVASVAIVGLTTTYLWFVVKSKGTVFTALVSLIITYVFIYIILDAEQYSILIGSIGLFLALAAVMISTRNVDWSILTATKKAPKVKLTSTESDPEEHI